MQAMLLRFTNGQHNQILFSDEKVCIYCSANPKQTKSQDFATDRGTLPESAYRVSRTQKPASVMVWAGVTATGRTPLIFIPEGVKINQLVYREAVLKKVSKPWARSHFGNDLWVFQDDSFPGHKAKATQQWCKNNFPRLISITSGVGSNSKVGGLFYGFDIPSHTNAAQNKYIIRIWN